MKKLFGTDGIRGVANTHPMTSETAVKIGRAAARVLSHPSANGIVIGKDTRISGDMLVCAVASGICSMGETVRLAGVMPTPGVAHLVTSLNAAGGIVVSASHNPYFDNGIKIFDKNGLKLSDDMELSVEHLISDHSLHALSEKNQEPGSILPVEDADHRYIRFLKTCLPKDIKFNGIKLVLDCGNGATYKIAPKLFSELGADVESLFIHPDGKNINDNCGSQHLGPVSKRVVETGADMGLAFDGDGDRLVAVDEKGNPVTGDKILAVCANCMKQKGVLKNNIVVSTVMSNIGLALALKHMNIRHIMADVGDRYVLKEMISHDAVLGGEDSGHMIFLDHHTTGDGLLTALKLLEALDSENKPLSELTQIMTVYPQILMNVEVTDKPEIGSVPEIDCEIRHAEDVLGQNGRVLVRYSGTQPLCRVMAEGPTEEITRRCCEQIADAVRKTIGKTAAS